MPEVEQRMEQLPEPTYLHPAAFGVGRLKAWPLLRILRYAAMHKWCGRQDAGSTRSRHLHILSAAQGWSRQVRSDIVAQPTRVTAGIRQIGRASGRGRVCQYLYI